MIDSTKAEFPSPLELLPPPYPSLWSSAPATQYARSLGCRVHGSLLSLSSRSGKSPITLFVHDGHLHWARIELPLLLHSNNSHLLQSQRDIDLALAAFSNRIQPLLRQTSGIFDSALFTRIDLTLQIQLPCSVRTFLSVLHRVSHAGRNPTLHPSGNLTYGSRKSASYLTLYDKARAMQRPAQGILRIEFKLSKHKLCELLGSSPDRYPSRLEFDRCYSAFRSQVIRFGVQSTEIIRFDTRHDFWSSLLAAAESRGLTMPDGRSYLEGLNDHYQVSAASRYRRRASDLGFSICHFDFPSEFPEAWPPPRLAPYVPDPLERYSPAFQHQNSELSGPQSLQPA